MEIRWPDSVQNRWTRCYIDIVVAGD